MLQAGSLGDVGKRAVAIVLEEMAVRLLPGGKALQAPAVDQKNIQPAIVVVVVERQPAAGGFEQILVLALAAVNGLHGQAGFLHHVDKADAQRSAFDRRLRTRSAGIGFRIVSFVRWVRSCCAKSAVNRQKGSTRAVRLSERTNWRRIDFECASAGWRVTGMLPESACIVPRHALVRNLRMLAQKLQRVSRRAGIHLLGGKQRRLLGGFFLHAHAAIHDGQVVVRGQIVGIDGLQSLELLSGFVVAVPLIVSDPQFAPRVARLRILLHHPLQVGHLLIEMPFAPFHQRQVVERAGIVRDSVPAPSPDWGAPKNTSPTRCKSDRC